MVEHELIDVLITAALYGTSRCDEDQRPLAWPGVPVDPHQVAIPGDWWGEFERAGLLWREFQERVTRENATQVGRMLLTENATSVGYRYMCPDGTLDPDETAYARTLISTYEFRRTRPQEPITILACLARYAYQACEHPTWEASSAFAFTRALTYSAIRDLPGYRDARSVLSDAGDLYWGVV